MRTLIIYFLSFLLITHKAQAQANATLSELFEQLNALNEQYQPDNSIYRGEHPAKFTFISHDDLIQKAEAQQKIYDQLSELDEADLSDQELINRSIRMLQLADDISRVTFKAYLIPFNAEGGFYNRPSFFLPNLPFKGREDFEKYLQWLPSFSSYIAYNIQLLELGIAEGITASKVIVQNNLELLQPWVGDDARTHPFYTLTMAKFQALSQDEKAILEAELIRVITHDILPSYKKLHSLLANEYYGAAPSEVGIAAIKNGKAYYENRVRHFTTLDITPDSVFKTGMAEVERIKGQMYAIINSLDFDGTFAEFIEFLRTDPQFYPKTAEDLLSRASWLSKQAEGALPPLFSQLYELPFTVAPVPDNIASNYTGGRYVGGSRSQDRPGTYWVNTYNLKSRPYYTLPALTLHEAVPGHHLQITIASELEDIPEFRRRYYISAFGEGWGLYSEYLGEEMGMYQTPYEYFGRYTYEMWRACRLVVDVGLHYKGWTREEAVTFMAGKTALSLHEVNTEINRYIGWPGQALSYKMGELMIKRLRRACEEELKDDFDIKEFHFEILKNGSVPLPILERVISEYLVSTKK